MKRILKYILILMSCVCIAAVSSNALQARADFGDYSGGSDYDFGGGWDSSDSGGSWSSGSGGSSWSSDSGSIWYGDDSSSHSSSGSSGGGFFMIVYVIVLVVVIIVVVNSLNQQKRSRRERMNQQPYTRPREDQLPRRSIQEYQKLDPGFDPNAFTQKMSNLYVQMQNCWTDKNIEPVRPYFEDGFYNQMNRQLQQKISRQQTNYVDRIAVLGCQILTWYQNAGMDYIVVELTTRIVDYTVDDRTGQVISGSKTAEKFMVYEWSVARKSGVVTSQNDGMHTLNCPHCGAPLDINASAKCPYCDSVITIEQNDWAITSIQGVSQRTVS